MLCSSAARAYGSQERRLYQDWGVEQGGKCDAVRCPVPMKRNLAVAAVKVDVSTQDVVRAEDLDPCQVEAISFGKVLN